MREHSTLQWRTWSSVIVRVLRHRVLPGVAATALIGGMAVAATVAPASATTATTPKAPPPIPPANTHVPPVFTSSHKGTLPATEPALSASAKPAAVTIHQTLTPVPFADETAAAASGGCASANGCTSLRAAIAQANTDGHAGNTDQITLQAGTYCLDTDQLVIDAAPAGVIIVGAGEANTTIEVDNGDNGCGAGTPPAGVLDHAPFRVMQIIDGTPAQISGVTIQDGGSYLGAPTVTGLSNPDNCSTSCGPAGGSVTITGTNFTGATKVMFGNQSAVFTVNSPTQITATRPVATTTDTATGTAIQPEGSVTSVTVTTPAGTSTPDCTSADTFTYNATGTSTPTAEPPADVAGISPSSGPVGTPVTITGSNFCGSTAVDFAALPATPFTVVSSTTITTTAPTGGSTGDVDAVTVTNPSTTASTPDADDNFTYATGVGSTPAVTTGPSPVEDGDGGGIEVYNGSLTLSTSTVTANRAIGQGGGVYVAGECSVGDCSSNSQGFFDNDTISNNQASGGGGIDNEGEVLASNSTIDANSAFANGIYSGFDTTGGGILMDCDGDFCPSFTGNNVAITNNQDPGQAGAGVFAFGAFVLTGTATAPSSISNNGGTAVVLATAPSPGTAVEPPAVAGGIFAGESVTLTDTNVNNNNSFDSGGGIFTGEDGPASVVVSGGQIDGNTAFFDGGGIYNSYGNVTLTNADVSNNTVHVDGGGIYNSNYGLTVTGGTINGNTASNGGPVGEGRDGEGGGVYLRHPASLSGTTIDGNTAGASGGGIYSAYSGGQEGTTSLTNVTLGSVSSPNTAEYGGGIYAIDNTTITGSTISGNEALYASNGGYGGGIYNANNTMQLLNSTVSDNVTDYEGGGIYNDSSITINGSTINGNSSGNTTTSDLVDYADDAYGGGIANESGLSMLNDTVAGNMVDGGTGTGYGGGIYNDSQATITNATIGVGNTCTGTCGGGAGIYDDSPLNLKGTIIAGNTANGTENGNDCFTDSGVVSAGYNLEGDASCTLSGPGDLMSTSPNLEALGIYNGGTTQTEPPSAGSPAIAADSACPPPSVDQNGTTRPQGSNGACTIGAVEVVGAGTGPGPGGPGGGGGGGGGGSTPPPATTGPNVVRDGGVNRVDTAVVTSQSSFPTAGSAGSVVLARSDLFPDALAGTPLAVTKHAPLLLTAPSTLDPETQAEIQRVLPAGGTVYLLGGTDALSSAVESTIGGLGFKTVRIGGLTRYATAVDIAQALGNPSTVMLATGLDFPDALSGGAAAAHTGGAVLLTNGSAMSPDTAAYLAGHPGDTVFALGGPAAAADPAATGIVGADRYFTATMVAQHFFTAPTIVGIATGLEFPDSLSGGARVASKGGPMLLTDPNALPSEVASYLTANKGTITETDVFGGTAAVTQLVFAAIQAALT